jgi:hypothetical protein
MPTSALAARVFAAAKDLNIQDAKNMAAAMRAVMYLWSNTCILDDVRTPLRFMSALTQLAQAQFNLLRVASSRATRLPDAVLSDLPQPSRLAFEPERRWLSMEALDAACRAIFSWRTASRLLFAATRKKLDGGGGAAAALTPVARALREAWRRSHELAKLLPRSAKGTPMPKQLQPLRAPYLIAFWAATILPLQGLQAAGRAAAPRADVRAFLSANSALTSLCGEWSAQHVLMRLLAYSNSGALALAMTKWGAKPVSGFQSLPEVSRWTVGPLDGGFVPSDAEWQAAEYRLPDVMNSKCRATLLPQRADVWAILFVMQRTLAWVVRASGVSDRAAHDTVRTVQLVAWTLAHDGGLQQSLMFTGSALVTLARRLWGAEVPGEHLRALSKPGEVLPTTMPARASHLWHTLENLPKEAQDALKAHLGEHPCLWIVAALATILAGHVRLELALRQNRVRDPKAVEACLARVMGGGASA